MHWYQQGPFTLKFYCMFKLYKQFQSKYPILVPIMQENALSSGKYYTAGKDFTWPMVASVATNPTSVLCIIILSSLIIFLSQPLHPLSSWSVILLAKLCWLLPHLGLWFSSLRRSHPLVRHTRILRLLLIFHRSHLIAKQVVHWTSSFKGNAKVLGTDCWSTLARCNASRIVKLKSQATCW